MTTKEHLDKIVAKIDQLLELAEKRTQGKWTSGVRYVACPSDSREIAMIPFGVECTPNHEWFQNGIFIAACAGPAEAGWRATKAAIEGWLGLFVYMNGFADGAPDASAHDKLCNEIASIAKTNIQKIIAAWPEELL